MINYNKLSSILKLKMFKKILRSFIKIKNNYSRKILSDLNTLNLFNHKYTVYYQKNDNNVFSKLCKKYMTNKGYLSSQLKDKNFNLSNYQNYDEYYSEIFSLNKDKIKNVFELGIGSKDVKSHYNMNFLGKEYLPGASLRVWRDYFINANIFGADIGKKVLFSDYRIVTHWVDQSDKDSIFKLYKNFAINNFDIMIDDGCHRFNETIKFFENSIDKLSDTGVYIIEDIALSQRKKFLQYFKQTNYNVKIVNFYRPTKYLGSNSIISIRKYN